MKILLILIFLPIQALSQPPWGSGPKPPDWVPPGQLPCWPPPCVSIGDYLPLFLIKTAILLVYYKLNKR